jgi:hypothetical protein
VGPQWLWRVRLVPHRPGPADARRPGGALTRGLAVLSLPIIRSRRYYRIAVCYPQIGMSPSCKVRMSPFGGEAGLGSDGRRVSGDECR